MRMQVPILMSCALIIYIFEFVFLWSRRLSALLRRKVTKKSPPHKIFLLPAAIRTFGIMIWQLLMAVWFAILYGFAALPTEIVQIVP